MRHLTAILTALLLAIGGVLVPTPAHATTVSVSGTVTFGSVAEPVAPAALSVWVRAVQVGTAGTIQGNYWSTQVAAGGSYSLPVPPGSYQIEFVVTGSSTYADYSSLWLGGTPIQSASTVVTVGSTPLNGLDIFLPLGSSVSGTVTAPPDADPIPNARDVRAYIVDPMNGVVAAYKSTIVSGNGQYQLRGLAPGDYLLRYAQPSFVELTFDEQLWQGADNLFDAELVTIVADTDLTGYDVQLTADGPLWIDRASGPDRLATAVAISQRTFGDASGGVVFIANGYNFPDGLSAGPAAAELGGPVLLSAADAIRADVIAEIDRLAPSHIVVVGGTNMVSAAAEQQLRSRYGTSTVTRLGGANRFETSAMLAAYAFPEGTDTAFVASGLKFPDALAAGPAAANRGGPVILVPATATLDPSVSNLLVDLGVQTVFIAGGEPSVPGGVEAGLRAVPGVLGVERFGGVDRYHTAMLINEAFFDYSSIAFLASGLNFPDALAGSAAAGALSAPIYLTPPECLYQGVYSHWRNAGGTLMVTLGGQPSVSDTAHSLIDC